MRNVIVTWVARADLGVVDELAALGVATVHEAIGRAGYLGPGLRPIQPGTRAGGTAVTAVCWPGDNLMIAVSSPQFYFSANFFNISDVASSLID